MNNNIRVGNLFGIPFYINPSLFLVLGLVTFSYGEQLSLFPQLNGLLPWLLGFIAALLLFASVLAHELGHSLVAISQGIDVKSITLFLFGGLANLEKESETPLEAFLDFLEAFLDVFFDLFWVFPGNNQFHESWLFMGSQRYVPGPGPGPGPARPSWAGI